MSEGAHPEGRLSLHSQVLQQHLPCRDGQTGSGWELTSVQDSGTGLAWARQDSGPRQGGEQNLRAQKGGSHRLWRATASC